MSTVQQLFDGANDFALCNCLFVRVCEVHGNGADARALTDEERTVYLVWGALGVIENGGFRYLFESEVNGDPHYALTRFAFEAIGCDEAVAAFDLALSAFPHRKPPPDAGKRVRAYTRHCPGFPTEADRAFFAATGAVERCLARWVRAHESGFRHLH